MRKKLCMVICVVTCAVLLLLCGYSSVPVVASETPVILSLMSEDECVEFAKLNGVSLPEIYENELDWGPFIKQVIMMAEKNPNVILPISHSAKMEVAEAICELVNAHYGTTMQSSLNLLSLSNAGVSDELVYSEIYSNWDERLKDYNCYGFAIETYEYIDPGFYNFRDNPPETIDPVNPAKYTLNVRDCEIDHIVDQVILDLTVQGKERIFFST